MALTGDLAQLHITDIIQLVHTTRQSGTFTVTGSRGESRIIFSNGHIVCASHLNNRIRIGSVLVKMNAISPDDLKAALVLQKRAGTKREPLIATLRHMGKLKDDAALKGLKKLIEITIVELINWKEGTFIFDSEAIEVSPECSYRPGEMEQGMALDAQMVLMDSLRVFDERERDRAAGREIPAYEDLFTEVLPGEAAALPEKKEPRITADVLGLADIDKLESKIPGPVQVSEPFDPVAMHKRAMEDALRDFSPDEQAAFVTFLSRYSSAVSSAEASNRKEGQARALVLFGTDALVTYSVMTICKNDGILVFPAASEDELDRIVTQCLQMRMLTVLVFDMPAQTDSALSAGKILSLQAEAKKQYPQAVMLQFSSPQDFAFTLKSFQYGMNAVLPRPFSGTGRETFVADMIVFLETFRAYINGFSQEQCDRAAIQTAMRLKEQIVKMRWTEMASEVTTAVLHAVAEACDRAIAFSVGPDALQGESALGVNAPRAMGQVSAADLKIPLGPYSVFRDVLESGQIFFGDPGDEVLQSSLYQIVGAPMRPPILLLPLKSQGQIRALIYGDFGKKEVPDISLDVFEILAHVGGLILENVQYRGQILKSRQKP